MRNFSKFGALLLASSVLFLSCKKATDSASSSSVTANSGWKVYASMNEPIAFSGSFNRVTNLVAYNGGIFGVVQSQVPGNSGNGGGIIATNWHTVTVKADGSLQDIVKLPFSYSKTRDFILSPNSKDLTAVNLVEKNNTQYISVTAPNGSTSGEIAARYNDYLFIESPQKFHSIGQNHYQGWSGGYNTHLYGATYNNGNFTTFTEGDFSTKDTAGLGLSSSPCYFYDANGKFCMLDQRFVSGKNYLYLWRHDSTAIVGAQTKKILMPRKFLLIENAGTKYLKHSTGILVYSENGTKFHNYSFATQTLQQYDLLTTNFPGNTTSQSSTVVRASVGEDGKPYIMLYLSDYPNYQVAVNSFSGSVLNKVGNANFINFEAATKLNIRVDNLFVVNNKPVVSLTNGGAGNGTTIMFVGAE